MGKSSAAHRGTFWRRFVTAMPGTGRNPL